jgi:transposase InsO family protein
LDMAVAQRQPSRGLLHHSDRGCQYTCSDYRKAYDQRQLEQRGDDN